MGTVYFGGEFRYRSWLKKSSQVHRKVKSTVVMRAGTVRGMMILE